MQAIVVIKIHDFSGLIDQTNISVAVDMVYELRNIAGGRLGMNLVSTCGDKIIGILPEVSIAMEEARHIMNILCPQNSVGNISTRQGVSCIPLSAAIGYGDLFQSVDGSYWGKEMNTVVSLSDDAGVREILLTNTAKRQLPQARQDVCEL